MTNRNISHNKEADVAEALIQLRVALRMEQIAFAKKIGVGQSVISKWEKRVQPIPLKRLMYFLQMSQDYGLKEISQTFERAAQLPPRLQKCLVGKQGGQLLLTDSKKVTRWHESDKCEVPVLSNPAAAGHPIPIEEKSWDYVLEVPRHMCPHPGEVQGVKVLGQSMFPILSTGCVTIVDTAKMNIEDLYNKIVVARDPDGEVTIKWLRRSGKHSLLVPENTDFEPIVLVPGWEIVGPVLWWIGEPWTKPERHDLDKRSSYIELQRK